MKKIVVTGALGHIGSKLIRALPLQHPQAEIVMLDNFSTQRYSSLFNLSDKTRYTFVEGDILTVDLNALFQNADAVIHLAAITDAEKSASMKERVEQVNFDGVKRVAEACVATKAALLFPSTTSVYGTQKNVVSELCSDEELKPQSPYAESKLRAEKLLSEMGKEKGLKFVVLRLGTIFGTSPGMRFHTAINKFCWQAALGQSISVWKTAYDQKRPYLGLEDAMQAFQLVLNKLLFNNQIYNVVTLNSTVRSIVETIQKKVPGLQVEFVDSAIMNQLSYEVDCRKFFSEGFKASDSLAEGIDQTLQLIQNAQSTKSAPLSS